LARGIPVAIRPRRPPHAADRPDGFFVDQDYLVTGETTAIRENGATSGIGMPPTFDYDDRRRISLT
jgi:hypothetical protein